MRWANAITAGGVLAVIAIAIFDVSSDTPFSHAVLYLIPVVAILLGWVVPSWAPLAIGLAFIIAELNLGSVLSAYRWIH